MGGLPECALLLGCSVSLVQMTSAACNGFHVRDVLEQFWVLRPVLRRRVFPEDAANILGPIWKAHGQQGGVV